MVHTFTFLHCFCCLCCYVRERTSTHNRFTAANNFSMETSLLKQTASLPQQNSHGILAEFCKKFIKKTEIRINNFKSSVPIIRFKRSTNQQKLMPNATDVPY